MDLRPTAWKTPENYIRLKGQVDSPSQQNKKKYKFRLLKNFRYNLYSICHPVNYYECIDIH